jgi:hypothetical protein
MIYFFRTTVAQAHRHGDLYFSALLSQHTIQKSLLDGDKRKGSKSGQFSTATYEITQLLILFRWIVRQWNLVDSQQNRPAIGRQACLF